MFTIGYTDIYSKSEPIFTVIFHTKFEKSYIIIDQLASHSFFSYFLGYVPSRRGSVHALRGFIPIIRYFVPNLRGFVTLSLALVMIRGKCTLVMMGGHFALFLFAKTIEK